MNENNNQKPLTLSDLGKFTEEVLLPAIDNLIELKLESKLEEKLESKLEEKFESKLAPIKMDIALIKEDIARIKEDLERIFKMESEDISAVNNELEKLKKRVVELENQLKILQIKQT